MKRILRLILIFTILIPCVWVALHKFEGAKPQIEIKIPSVYLKKEYEISLNISDQRTGLRKTVVSIMQQGKEKLLLEKTYAQPDVFRRMTGPVKTEDNFIIPVQYWKYGMTDGEAALRIMVSDYSWRGWNKGNIGYLEKKVIIDTIAPQLTVLSKQHNIEQGGSGLVIYRVFEADVKSGIQVGENFFPGRSGVFENQYIHTAFFALDHLQGPGTQLSVVAEDQAGNITKRGFHHYIRARKLKKDTLNITDRFLEQKISAFDFGTENNTFQEIKNPLLEKFLFVNEDVRKQNIEKILSIPSLSGNKWYWEGRFARQKGAVRRSGFADRRVYKYKGKEIDKAVHLGIDLASTANAPVRAANSGRVIFAQFEGIFGNTVIIDHGFGLCSLYAHLNRMTVKKGDMIRKLDDIGFTGQTGLAGGDHLHFSMIVHNTFVNPIEWWDSRWIKNNITSKIKKIKQAPNK